MAERRRSSLLDVARRLLAASVVLGWLRAGATVGLLLWAGAQLDRGLDGRALESLGAALVLVGLRVAAGLAAPRVAAAAGSRVELDLRDRLYRKVLALGSDVDRDRSTGELVARATEGVEAVGAYAGTFLPMLVQGITVPLGVIGVIAFLDPVTALALVVVVPLVPMLLRLLERRFRSVSERYRRNADRLAGRFLDALQGLTTLRAYRRSRAHGEELAGEAEELRGTTMRLLLVNQLALFAVDSLFSLGTIGVATVVVALRAGAGLLTAGEAVAVVLLAAVLVEALGQVGRFFYVGAIGRASVGVVSELLALPVPEHRAVAEEAPPGSVRMRGVRFSYPNGPAVLDGVDLDVRPGETVAVVGPSGAGKTTLVELVLGLHGPDEGHVAVGGAVTFVPQDPYLFNGSLVDNLRLADPTVDQDGLVEAARASHLLEVVERLPRGWDTEVGERGLELSAGEAQRVAIARALLRDAPIVVLDEPTSNVDPASELAIREGIARLAAGRTVIVVAHRFSTVAGAARVVVLEAGRVVEEGTPAELGAGDGLLARMAPTRGPA